MAQIEPIVFPFVGTATTLKVKVLPFDADDTTCGTHYQLLTDTGLQCIQGNYYLTEEQFANWGQNNYYIDELVAASIPVTLLPLPVTEPIAIESAPTEPIAIESAPTEPIAIESAPTEPIAIESAPTEPIAIESQEIV